LPNAVAQSAHEDTREPFSLNQMGSPSVALEAKTVLSVEQASDPKRTEPANFSIPLTVMTTARKIMGLESGGAISTSILLPACLCISPRVPALDRLCAASLSRIAALYR